MKTADFREEYIELREEIPSGGHVAFDSNSALLEGSYDDELSCHRAKKGWVQVLENQFLLEKDYDFTLKIKRDHEAGSFSLKCNFVTACGRYAFWRLTNAQALEAQYTIETAHIPHAESMYEKLLSAPDLAEKQELTIRELNDELPYPSYKKPSVVHWLRALIKM